VGVWHADWIDKLKQEQNTNERSNREREQWKLRCDEMISSKAPLLLAEIISHVKADIARLREVFPNDESRHIQIDEEGPTFIHVTRPTIPYVELGLSWWPRERLIGLQLGRQPDQNSPMQPGPRNEISFFGGTDDVVKMKLDGVTYVTPACVSERLLKMLFRD
jgi:hypothetical protein